ncbi:Glutamate receptor ionotropic, delta-1 [Portunus trituberculatus]|uniref:Glutamate receptor ionotropic, delta-1 n=1 Tax=Portunus trituberculatus TaxID=210409 RepID=A0A5B7FDS7_PORTR|nr:Glutamate receptor ionotropic, delta-1 [Portunus trituberculatus]
MARAVALLVAGLLQLVASQRTLLPDNHESQALRSAAASVLAAHTPCLHTTVFVTDAAEGGEMLQAPRGLAVLREVDGGKMGGAWHCLVVVVVSDDPAFLAAFAHLSLRRHALRWSTRILVLTRLPLSHLGGLHDLLSNRNAMLLHVQEGEEAARFTTPPTLTVAVEFLPYHTLTWVKDPHEPGGRRLLFTGFMNNFVMYFAKAMNFKYRYVLSHERTFGNKLPNGSWTGMLGMVVREEADFSPAPFALNPARNEAVDPSSVYGIVQVRILSGLTGLKIDPWGFLLPLTHLVWAVTVAALLGVLFVLQLFPSCLPGRSLLCSDWSVNAFSPVRVLLQQGYDPGIMADPSAKGCIAI